MGRGGQTGPQCMDDGLIDDGWLLDDKWMMHFLPEKKGDVMVDKKV